LALRARLRALAACAHANAQIAPHISATRCGKARRAGAPHAKQRERRKRNRKEEKKRELAMKYETIGVKSA